MVEEAYQLSQFTHIPMGLEGRIYFLIYSLDEKDDTMTNSEHFPQLYNEIMISQIFLKLHDDNVKKIK